METEKQQQSCKSYQEMLDYSSKLTSPRTDELENLCEIIWIGMTWHYSYMSEILFKNVDSLMHLQAKAFEKILKLIMMNKEWVKQSELLWFLVTGAI